MLDLELEEELRPALSPNERLVWTGKPKTGIVFRKGDVFLVPFSLLWGGFAFFWEDVVVTSGAPIFFMLWGIPFVLVGLYITVGRFFADAKKRANTLYGITQDRIIIKSGLFSQDIKSVNIHSLSDITLEQRSDNSGSIMLGSTDIKNSLLQGTAWPGVKQTPCLEFIEEVKSVYDKIIALQRQSNNKSEN
jgi:hypothetical protein